MAKIDWLSLSQEQRIKVLSATNLDKIVASYSHNDDDDAAFLELLDREKALWQPQNIGVFKHKGSAPTKDVVLGAWRDLERSEALLELIDNSIDAWLRLKSSYPSKAPKELNIFIDIDAAKHQLIYEDNAGGVSVDKLEHLVVPGHSDTDPLSATIGSYKTGGKKAIFRLATAAQVMTRFLSPAGTSDDAYSVQLNESWLSSPTQYEFPYAKLKDKTVLDVGQTRYRLQLREEPVGGTPWFEEPGKIAAISKEIQKAYKLLLVRNPAIRIFFRDLATPLPHGDLYAFSGKKDQDIDVQPQQVIFDTEIPFQGVQQSVKIEIVLGCRKTVGQSDGGEWGIDLYGNNRLFVECDQVLFADFFPQGNSRRLLRGFVNILGPNTFVPWDTHKRHLNNDREIITVLTKNPVIRELFENWKKAYLDISRSTLVKTVAADLPKQVDLTKHDLFIPHRDTVKLDVNRKRGACMPKEVFVPKVKGKKAKEDKVNIAFKLSIEEGRPVASHFKVTGALTSPVTMSALSGKIKEDVLKRSRSRGR